MATDSNGVVTWVPWVDHNHPYDFRITLPYKKGAAFQSITAAFITSIVFPAIWTIVSFTLHQFQASDPQLSFPQRLLQVFLRNHSTPIWVVWKNARVLVDNDMGERRERINRKTLLRCFYVSVIALAIVGATITAAIESAKISTGIADFVLLRSSQCGTWSLKDESMSVEGFNEWQNITRGRVLDAATYATACYRNQNQDPSCTKLAARQLPWTGTNNASCPFKNGTCLFSDTAAYEMTTDLLDSDVHFGINAPEHSRVKLQKRTTCSMMRTTGYFDQVPGPLSQEVITRYFYGNWTTGDAVYNTYNVSHNASYYGKDYVLGNFQAQVTPINGTVADDVNQPAPDFIRYDADPSFFFLQAGSVSFVGLCDDPMYSAHRLLINSSVALAGNIYGADYYATVMGCADQYRMCNPASEVCTPFTGVDTLPDEVEKVFIAGKTSNAAQISTVTVLYHAITLSQITAAVNGRASQALQALNNFIDGSQYPLPNEQWKLEASSWFDVVLATMQLDVYNFASGPDASRASFINITKPIDESTCHVKVHGLGLYKTFSGVGVCLIFAVGGALWVISWFFDTIVGFVQCYTGVGAQRRAQWNADSNTALLYAAMNNGPRPEGATPMVYSQDTSYRGYEAVGKQRESVLSEEVTSPITPAYDAPKPAMY